MLARLDKSRLRTLTETAVDGIILIDARGRILMFNPGAARGCSATRRRGDRPERQDADALALPRRARRLPRQLLDDRRAQDHRHRPRGHRPAQGRHDLSDGPVGRRGRAWRRVASSSASSTTSPNASNVEQALREREARLQARGRNRRRRHHPDRRRGHGSESFNPACERLFGYAPTR